jgi:hypothetical protein
METNGTILLFTLAGLMVTFAGFSTLLVSVRQTAGASLSALDRYLARTVLIHLMLLTAGALLPSLLALYDLPAHRIWRISAVLFGVPKLLLLATYPHRRYKAVGGYPPPIVFAVFIVFGSAVVLAMMICILVGLPHAAAAYVTALIVNFFTCAFAFVIALDVIMRQPGRAPGQ